MARPHNSPDVFRAIAHPVRRRILEMLRARDLPASQLVREFSMSQPTISEHLRALRVAGLVAYRVRGNQHVYSLVRTGLRPIVAWSAAFK